MTGPAQELFFRKVWRLFNRATVGIALANKKRYRMTGDELTEQRNLAVLFAQLFPQWSSGVQSSFEACFRFCLGASFNIG